MTTRQRPGPLKAWAKDAALRNSTPAMRIDDVRHQLVALANDTLLGVPIESWRFRRAARAIGKLRTDAQREELIGLRRRLSHIRRRYMRIQRRM